MQESKICLTCKIQKILDEFPPSKNRMAPNGKHWRCTECQNQALEKRKEYKKSYSKIKYSNERDILLEQHRQRRIKNRNEILERERINRLKNKNKSKAKYRENHPEILKFLGPFNEKTCSKCNLTKYITEYNKDNDGWFGYSHTCRECIKQINKERYHQDKERYCNYGKEYRKKYPEKTSNWLKKYRQTEKGMKTIKNYKQQDQVKIAERLRTRLRTAVKLYDANKTNPTLEYLGCPLWYFMAYLRAHFTQDMNWQMLMNGDLELDHTVPFCSLDLTIEENLKKVCHYTNIRPIFAKDNHSKASKDKLLSIH